MKKICENPSNFAKSTDSTESTEFPDREIQKFLQAERISKSGNN